MTPEHQPVIESLQAQVKLIEPQDTMAEAGRKALLKEFIEMLQHEDGSRAGADVEEVHDMRVAIRRMRSTLRLLAAYYKPKAIHPYLQEMRKIALALGAVRDLDVMIGELQAFQETLDPEQRPHLQPVLDQLDDQRRPARSDLIRLLDKGGYRRFVEDFAQFVTKPGKGAHAVDLEDVHPFQVRHVLPTLIYAHVGAVRAYEDALADADVLTLHALRIEFKRLRYIVTVFSDVLGSTSSEFIDELKAFQDQLGKINDIRTAKERLNEIAKGQDDAALAVLLQYVEFLDDERKTLRDGIDEMWKHFNTKTVQRQLATAVAGL